MKISHHHCSVNQFLNAIKGRKLWTSYVHGPQSKFTHSLTRIRILSTSLEVRRDAMFVGVTGCSLKASPAGNGGVGLRPPSLFTPPPSIRGFDGGGAASGCAIASFDDGGGAEFSEGLEFELVSLTAAAAAVTEVVMTVAPMPCRRASTLQNLLMGTSY